MTRQQKIYKLLKQDINLIKKYLRPGCYSISISGQLVYIGKSLNVLKRISQHMAAIEVSQQHKYQVLRSAKQRGYTIDFELMYAASGKIGKSIEKEIGEREGELIRKYLPALNYQIPKKEDFHKYTKNQRAMKISLDQILYKTDFKF